MVDAKGDKFTYAYDGAECLTGISQKVTQGGAERTVENLYTYEEDRLTAIQHHGFAYGFAYDSYGNTKSASIAGSQVVSYEYEPENGNLKKVTYGNGDSIRYTYDKDSREVTVRPHSNRTRTITYDPYGRVKKLSWNTAVPFESTYGYFNVDETKRYSLPRVLVNGTARLDYTYDGNGILQASGTVKEYAFTTAATLPETPEKLQTGTYDAVWKDQLLTWDGTAMTYDAIGNMLTRGSTSYTWTQGRKLATVNNGKAIQYFYDHTGNRTRKVVDGVTTDYFYIRNAQNDIIGLVDENGDVVENYKYDSWGKVLSITGSLANTIGKRNPFRYRGYYYDTETGMYYLKSRYYDLEIRRFINADSQINNTSAGGITQVDSPLPGPADVVGGVFAAVGVVVSGIIALNSMVVKPQNSLSINKRSESLSGIAGNYGIGKCKEAADAMVIELKRKRRHGKIITMQYEGLSGGKFNSIWCVSRGIVIATNGFHCGVEYNNIVYCNVHPLGLPEIQWLADFEGLGKYKTEEILF